jgi:hypothetical protein
MGKLFRKTYNRHLSHSDLKAASKAALVAVGVAYGLHKGLTGGERNVGAADADARRDSGPSVRQAPEAVPATLESRVSALENGPARRAAQQVSRLDLAEAIQQATDAISSDLDRRFEVQRLSIHSLHALVAQTDRLLEQMLRRLEDASA